MSYQDLSPLLEAIIYLAKEPVSVDAICKALPDVSRAEVEEKIKELIERFRAPEHGIEVREVAGGLKFSTKPEHHEVLKQFIKSQIPPTRLSLAALETLAVIAYKQPVTAPEIMEIRGVQGAGVIKTLLDRKVIAVAGRKNVIGKPILYKTTKEFLIQFGLKDLSELPSLKEFEEIRRMAFDSDTAAAEILPVDGAEGAATEGAETESTTPDTGELRRGDAEENAEEPAVAAEQPRADAAEAPVESAAEATDEPIVEAPAEGAGETSEQSAEATVESAGATSDAPPETPVEPAAEPAVKPDAS